MVIHKILFFFTCFYLKFCFTSTDKNKDSGYVRDSDETPVKNLYVDNEDYDNDFSQDTEIWSPKLERKNAKKHRFDIDVKRSSTDEEEMSDPGPTNDILRKEWCVTDDKKRKLCRSKTTFPTPALTAEDFEAVFERYITSPTKFRRLSITRKESSPIKSEEFEGEDSPIDSSKKRKDEKKYSIDMQVLPPLEKIKRYKEIAKLKSFQLEIFRRENEQLKNKINTLQTETNQCKSNLETLQQTPINLHRYNTSHHSHNLAIYLH
jgi:hypothetical protein